MKILPISYQCSYFTPRILYSFTCDLIQTHLFIKKTIKKGLKFSLILKISTTFRHYFQTFSTLPLICFSFKTYFKQYPFMQSCLKLPLSLILCLIYIGEVHNCFFENVTQVFLNLTTLALRQKTRTILFVVAPPKEPR
jgi:hypothetical protein